MDRVAAWDLGPKRPKGGKGAPAVENPRGDARQPYFLFPPGLWLWVVLKDRGLRIGPIASQCRLPKTEGFAETARTKWRASEGRHDTLNDGSNNDLRVTRGPIFEVPCGRVLPPLMRC
jgi:hypothetical protein